TLYHIKVSFSVTFNMAQRYFSEYLSVTFNSAQFGIFSFDASTVILVYISSISLIACTVCSNNRNHFNRGD
ncbi:hypothetical protein, partial [Nitrosospira sp. Nsp18]|uniref:hypothetical protein n=1 Tax=Nitrosospira sp. Nsp18 TaxID=1855334 RepID=UPI001C40AD47